ncbi:very low-density lipoprotein receptor-like, partial [Octopus bimaculoides]|uniref:very low-density lipoprotein receptor-like n=1 Tax=Octopus bimaculoides TaxID=37653 RepID=UPI0022DF15AA
QDEYLLYAFRDRIKDIDLQNSAPRSSSFMAIFDRRKALLDFDYNRKTNYVYYISERSSQQTITQITTSGLNKTSWPAELFLGKPNSLAIDWISRNLFWSSTDSKSIHVMKMNSNFTIHKIILGNSGKQTDVSFPTSLCLDPSKGLLYWTDKGSYDIPVKIGAVKMDGSDPQILVKDNMQTPGFLTKDPNDPILYWSDGQLGK